jgi:hypothetical protein
MAAANTRQAAIPGALLICSASRIFNTTDGAPYGSHWRPASSLPTLEPPIAYVGPLTIQGRRWLWNHVKYPYAGSNAIVDADELTIHW